MSSDINDLPGAVVIDFAAQGDIGAITVRGIGATSALYDVIVERNRQIEVEGWTAAHDDENASEELAFAAACYATGSSDGWPWRREWWKPGTYRRNLIKAAALVLAEIERIDRAAKRRDGAS